MNLSKTTYHYTPLGIFSSNNELTSDNTAKKACREVEYRFNGKELDQETGYAYYGARYYDNQLSVWLSVDAMASRGPNITPFAFSHNNPMMLIDPDGNWPGDPKKLTQAAKAAVNYVKGTDSGSQPAKCNWGVNHAFQSLTGSSELEGMRANEMYDQMSSSANFTPVEISEVQALANQGEIIIAAWKNPSGSSGHVALAVPGQAATSGTWEGKSASSIGGIPVFMDTGYNTRTESRSVNYSFGRAKQADVVFFRYSDPNMGYYDVYNEDFNMVVPTYISKNVLERDYTPWTVNSYKTIWYRTYQAPPPPPRPQEELIHLQPRGLAPIIVNL